MLSRRIALFLFLSLSPLVLYAQTLNDELMAAVRKGDLAAVKSLLARGADVNARTNYGATPLHFASDRGNLEMVKALVEAGADISAKDSFYKFTPQMMALMHRHTEVVNYLQQLAAAREKTQQPAAAAPAANTAALNEELIEAAKKGDLAAVKSLLAKGANVNAKTSYGVTPLIFASDRGHLEVVKTLLEAGADLNVVDTFYKAMTALSSAADKGHAAVVKLLLEKGAQGKERALMTGVFEGHREVVKVVLDQGGLKPETLTQALGNALERNQTEIAKLLKKAGATPPPPKPPPPEVKVDDETLKKYAGTYRNKDGMEYTFVFKDGKLSGWDSRQFIVTLSAIDQTAFRLVGFGSALVTFNQEGGRVTGITIKQGNSSQTYHRMGDK